MGRAWSRSQTICHSRLGTRLQGNLGTRPRGQISYIMATQSVSRAPWFRRGLLQAYHYLSPAAVCSHTGGGVASLSTDGKSSQDSVTDTEGTQDRYGTRTVIRGLYPSGVPLFGRIRHGSALHYQYSYITMRRNLHSSSFVRGLEEFFPKSDNIIEEGEKTGR